MKLYELSKAVMPVSSHIRLTIISALAVGACARGVEVDEISLADTDAGTHGKGGSSGSTETTGAGGSTPTGSAGTASPGTSGGPGVSVGSGGAGDGQGAAGSSGSGASGSGGATGSGGAGGAGGSGGGSSNGCDSAIDRDCPTGIAIGVAVPGPAFGGNGGSVFMLPCAADQVLTGFDGRSGDSVDRLQPFCSTFATTAPGGALQITTTGATLLATEGGGGGSAFSDRCPANQVVIGISGRQLPELERFGFICGSVTVVRAGASGPWQIAVTRAMDSPQHGGTDGTVFEYLCPSGTIATVFSGRRGDRMDQASLYCAPLTLKTM